MGWKSSWDMLVGHRDDVKELDSEGGASLVGELGEMLRFSCIKTDFDCHILRAFRMIRSDSSRNMTSSRFR